MIKERTIKQLYKNVIIRNSIFFASMTAFMIWVLWSNLNNTSDNAGLILFVVIISSLCSCFFEMRIVRKTGEFLMPTARILMFLAKPIIFVLGYVVMILSFRSAMENYLKYLLLCLYLVVATGLFYLGAIMLFRKKDESEECYIDYMLIKLTRPKNRNSALIGIITSSILLAGITTLFAVCRKFDPSTIVGFVIIALLLIWCEIVYIQELIKKGHGGKR